LYGATQGTQRACELLGDYDEKLVGVMMRLGTDELADCIFRKERES
jgi:hypothetical protein